MLHEEQDGAQMSSCTTSHVDCEGLKVHRAINSNLGGMLRQFSTLANILQDSQSPHSASRIKVRQRRVHLSTSTNYFRDADGHQGGFPTIMNVREFAQLHAQGNEWPLRCPIFQAIVNKDHAHLRAPVNYF